ncbi:GCN5-related N-acetyltransferase [Paraglaciecola sp. T6c]|uniref:GNAT family N-acetyltransferase n=1 Tax=Pseudoalteromonas atlantica (strain T6c / ATCC BAA-1087) TaxID=3042615 RepID=UPI00005C6E5B|nr:GNAT family N-acetyltransferase [Paraglaciecola sp. T6c]ABG38874.1 GCN5-related N-acetyltransferase [Paraglaciecola sp. T6c]
MQINLIPLGEEHSVDISALAMRSKAYWGYSPAFMQQCAHELTYSAQQIAHNDFHFVGAFSSFINQNSSPLGFYALQRISREEAELLALFVCPTQIGCGLGQALLQHAISAAKSQHFTSLVIYSDPNAAAFYAKNGARRVGTQPSGSIAGRELPVYQIQL